MLTMNAKLASKLFRKASTAIALSGGSAGISAICRATQAPSEDLFGPEGSANSAPKTDGMLPNAGNTSRIAMTAPAHIIHTVSAETYGKATSAAFPSRIAG